jgi:(p)ppGpp synthase/HD superfamily hydrolase
LERAIALAVRYHTGQRDKANQPYLLHLFRVMQEVQGPIAKQAAILHDFIEDVGGTLVQLEREGIDREAIDAIALLTHDTTMSYGEYVLRLSQNATAKQVKIADLNDNYRLDRVALRAEYRAEDTQRIERYILSFQFLQGALPESEYRKRMALLES